MVALNGIMTEANRMASGNRAHREVPEIWLNDAEALLPFLEYGDDNIPTLVG